MFSLDCLVTSEVMCFIQQLIRESLWSTESNLIPPHTMKFDIIEAVHSPTNALFINLVKSFKFTLK